MLNMVRFYTRNVLSLIEHCSLRDEKGFTSSHSCFASDGSWRRVDERERAVLIVVRFHARLASCGLSPSLKEDCSVGLVGRFDSALFLTIWQQASEAIMLVS